LTGFGYKSDFIEEILDEFPARLDDTAAAEDLVVMKSFAGRDQDWIDVRGILLKQGGTLDWVSYIWN